mgnify:FL=1
MSSDRAGNHRACVGQNQCDRVERNRRLRAPGKDRAPCKAIRASSGAKNAARTRGGGKPSPRTRLETKAPVLGKTSTPVRTERAALGRRRKSGQPRGPEEASSDVDAIPQGNLIVICRTGSQLPLARQWDEGSSDPEALRSEPHHGPRTGMGPGFVQAFGPGWRSRMGQPRPFGVAVHEG